MELHYGPHTFQLADDAEPSAIFDVIREARQQAVADGSEALPVAEIPLAGGRSVQLLVERGVALAVEQTVGNPETDGRGRVVPAVVKRKSPWGA